MSSLQGVVGMKGEKSMAIAVLFEAPGVTQEQYDATLREVGSELQPGQIFHLAGPMEDGWRVVDVWESQEALDTFWREKLGQAMQNAGMPELQPEVFQVHNMSA
jgi:hypothetical protein